MTAWYVARTKPKHEHIAAASLRKQLDVNVFFPRLQSKKLTKRGLVSFSEPLFPGYIFVRCWMEEQIDQIQCAIGMSQVVHFGGVIPKVPDEVISELRDFFGSDDGIVISSNPVFGEDVALFFLAFLGMNAFVLKNLPAKKRVQILLEFLGRPTMVEVGREALISKKNSLVDLAPFLTAPFHQERVLA